jgi:hypothetical protein
MLLQRKGATTCASFLLLSDCASTSQDLAIEEKRERGHTKVIGTKLLTAFPMCLTKDIHEGRVKSQESNLHPIVVGTMDCVHKQARTFRATRGQA